MVQILNETAFEKHIAEYLSQSPLYVQRSPKDFDIERLIDVEMFAAFFKAQTDTWRRLVKNFGSEEDALDATIAEYNRQLRRGTSYLKLLREGFTLQGATVKLLQFKPDMNLNDDNQRLYEANRFAVVRQMHYSVASADKQKELDLCILVNGFPLMTFELKNEGTGQNVANGMHQYCYDRDKTNKMLNTCLVHFAMDTNRVMMTTKLAGEETYFLPFNKETENPIVEGDYATCYMWKEILQADSLLNILQHFIKQFHSKPGTPYKTIFPRYHQLRCVRNIIGDVKVNGVGTNYLVQHSAGSGKTNSMAWLAHQLANLQNPDNTPVFDSVIMVTDRIVLDRNIADAIKAFETVPGTVKDIRHGSKNLARALEEGGKIIVSTVQKFAFAQEHLSKLAGHHFAVIIDEAHSAMGSEAAKDIRVTLSSEDQLKSVVEESDPEISNDVDRMYSEMQAARRMMKHISYFAFTATPKERTFALFGTKDGKRSKAFDVYEMRQAIEEGFIKDVLLNYTTFQTMFELIGNVSEEEHELYEKTGALRVAMKFVNENPYAINYKADMILTYFMQNTLHKMQNQAKAMVVTSSRADAVRYKKALDKIIHEKYNDRIKTLVAFSGMVEIDGHQYTEENMNGFGIKDNGIKVKFEEPEEKILIVAEKFQTGFDQPLLHTMFVDKILGGIQCVQTLSRLNRCHPDKEDTMVFDFVNTFEDVQKAFEPYYQTTYLDGKIDTQKLYDFKADIDDYGCFTQEQIDEVALVLANPDAEPAVLSPMMRKIVDDKVKEFPEDEQSKYRKLVNRYIRQYGFIAQIMCFLDPELEKYYVFLKLLYKFLPYTKETLPLDLLNKIDLSKFRVQVRETGSISLEQVDGLLKPTQAGKPTDPAEKEMITLKDLLRGVNEPYAGFLDENDKLLTHLLELLKQDPEVIQAFSAHNTMDMIMETLKTRFNAKAYEEIGKYINLIDTMQNDQIFTDSFFQMTIDLISDYINQASKPEYNQEILENTLVEKFYDKFSYVCNFYDVEFADAVHFMVSVLASVTDAKFAGLKKLPEYLNHIYLGSLLPVQNSIYYGHLLTKFEAYLRRLYLLRKGESVPKPIAGLDKATDGLVWVMGHFRDLHELYNTTDLNLKDFKEAYRKLFTVKDEYSRNDVSHAAPEIPDSEINYYFEAIVSMYFFATIISYKEILKNLSQTPE